VKRLPLAWDKTVDEWFKRGPERGRLTGVVSGQKQGQGENRVRGARERFSAHRLAGVREEKNRYWNREGLLTRGRIRTKGGLRDATSRRESYF